MLQVNCSYLKWAVTLWPVILLVCMQWIFILIFLVGKFSHAILWFVSLVIWSDVCSVGLVLPSVHFPNSSRIERNTLTAGGQFLLVKFATRVCFHFSQNVDYGGFCLRGLLWCTVLVMWRKWIFLCFVLLWQFIFRNAVGSPLCWSVRAAK